MFGQRRLNIEPELWARLCQAAEKAGYSSTEEFIEHVLEKAAGRIEEARSEAEVRKRLQGLGYLD